MSLQTVLLAITPDDDGRLEELAETTIQATKPAEATAVVGHAFTGTEYNDALGHLGIDTDREDVRPDAVAARHERVESVVDALEGAGVGHEVRGAVGTHGQAIPALAEEIEADRIVIGGRRRSPTGKAVFGSTSQEVMLASPCPVIFVPESD